MSSSISSSSNRTEIKVVLFVVAGILAAELAIRLTERHLSRDVDHIRSAPLISSKFEQQPNTILFLGNSLVRYGMDIPTIQEQLEKSGMNFRTIEKFHPDASSLGEWEFYLKKYFVRSNHLPETLIVGFATNHLEDRRVPRPEVLGAYCCDIEDTPEVFDELPSLDARADFMISLYSSAFAERDRLRSRTLNALIPAYQATTVRLNGVQRHHQHSVDSKPTFNRLKAFLQENEQYGIKVVLVAMPVRDEAYDIADIAKVAQENGAKIVDCRHVEGIGHDSFVDDIHLGAAGSKIFSTAFCRKLAEDHVVTVK